MYVRITNPCTVELSHHIRIGWHWTTWLAGSMENTKSGLTFCVVSKHEVSDEGVTWAATLVPPEPNPEESLIWE
jgi:hypothetical protein